VLEADLTDSQASQVLSACEAWHGKGQLSLAKARDRGHVRWLIRALMLGEIYESPNE
jgi:hypothetical protein